VADANSTAAVFPNSSRHSLAMKLYILDAESYYDREFNLRRIDPASYILDPRFELIGIAVKEPGIAAYWVEGPDASAFFASLDSNDIMTASHNALFDNCIWSYCYGFVPIDGRYAERISCCAEPKEQFARISGGAFGAG
jgi:hypothetical protein